MGVPLVVATQAQKDEFRQKLNEVSEELLGRCKPRHSMRRVNVPVYSGMITLPRYLSSANQMGPAGCCCSSPMLVYTKFHEFAQGGIDCCADAIPATEIAQTFKQPDSATAFTLRVSSTAAGGTMSFIGGRDADWNEYHGAGVTVTIVNGDVDTTRTWKALPMIEKPVTTAAVELYAVTGGVETLLAIYAPNETVPAYMRYLVPWACDGELVMVLGKLAHVDVVDDTDIVFPSSYRALRLGLIALDREAKADFARAQNEWALAVERIDAERKEQDGDATAHVNMLGGVGLSDLACVR